MCKICIFDDFPNAQSHTSGLGAWMWKNNEKTKKSISLMSVSVGDDGNLNWIGQGGRAQASWKEEFSIV